MIDIKEIEEGVMIEVQEWNYPLSNLINDIRIADKGLTIKEAYRYASLITGSLLTQGLITIQKGTYENSGGDSFTFVSGRDLTEEEIEHILKEPEKWSEEEIQSFEDVYELAVTDKGRSY